jgi:hypothetical protein
MKSLISKSLYCVLLFTLGCSQNDPIVEGESDFTGREITYALESASEFNISGTAVIKEKRDLSTDIVVTLNKTFQQNAQFPVHLHLGDVSTDNADIAASLQPVEATRGVSETLLTILADESKVTFDDISRMNACIKIHLSASGPEKDVVLAAGNIGQAFNKNLEGGRLKIGLCKSE